ncbi:hydroxyacid dehydrogenase [Rhizobium lentis]|uniref:NAD(P)-dependent oxidoreductase n=1 Tax=Rhizobium lentis TaxID=1138194 RepID=UPI001C8385D0|nr:NAD(P)-dependent oxidoreductase [Rhizobium lentis]MBX5143082.1 hydroxyacid dehydrogenase [Rhizobium lentis]
MSQTTNILVLEPENYSPHALATYRQMGKVWLGQAESNTEVSIIVVRLAYRIDGTLLDRFPSLRAVVSPTTALTHVDVEECRRRGIEVISLADCRDAINDITSTAELALGLMISLLRAIPCASSEVVRNGSWNRNAFRSRQLSRMTLGIIGLGRLGRHMARYAKALCMEIVAYDPYQPQEKFDELGVRRSDLLPLLKEADIISIHASLTGANYGFLGRSEIAEMRSHALVVNTARGGLIDEAALADALRDGKLGGVAVDVLRDEDEGVGWMKESPLIRAAKDGFNVLITPHIGGCTSDAMHVTEESIADVAFKKFGG